MIQAIGLTSTVRRKRLPRVDDLSFEARPGEVTVLLGPAGSGKSEVLQLMLQLVPGRGVTLFRGRPVMRIPYPAREIGCLLGDVRGHPARTARGHLRMLTAVAGVPLERADEVLDVVGLSGLADQRLGDFSLGMDRRLGMAAALLADPHTLVLDEPARELSPRESSWLQGVLRSYAARGGLVLVTARDAREAARLGDRVVSIDRGRLVADQEAADFSRTRLRPRVVVRTPHTERLAAVLSQEARSAARMGSGGEAVEVVREGGNRVSVYGSDCAAVGECAFRHGILVHRLADEIGDTGDRFRPGALSRADGRASGQEREVATAAVAAAVDKRTGSKAKGEMGGNWTVDVGQVMPRDAVTREGEGEIGTSGHASVPAPGSYKPSGSSAPEECGPAEAAAEPQADSGAVGGSVCDGRAERDADTGRRGPEAYPVVERRTAHEQEPSAAGGELPASALVSAGHEKPGAAGAVPGGGVRPAQRPLASSPGSTAAYAADGHTELSESAECGPMPPLALEQQTGSRIDSKGVIPDGCSPVASVSGIAERRGASAPVSVSAVAPVAAGPAEARVSAAPSIEQASGTITGRGAGVSAGPAVAGDSRRGAGQAIPLPESPVVRRPGPVAPLRYELLRLFGVRTTWVLMGLALFSALLIAAVVAGTEAGVSDDVTAGSAPGLRLLTGWPPGSPFLVPPAAVVSGVLGARAFGEEFRYPALVPAQVPVPRRLGLLVAKLVVTAGTAVVLCLVTALCNGAVISLFYGVDSLAQTFPDQSFDIEGLTAFSVPAELGSGVMVPSLGMQVMAVLALCVGCAWAGLLAAGVFRRTALGVVAVVAVPTLVAPLVRKAAVGSRGLSFEGLPERLRSTLLFPWPEAAEHSGAVAVGIVSQPVGRAFALSVAVLFCAYTLMSLRGRPRRQ